MRFTFFQRDIGKTSKMKMREIAFVACDSSHPVRISSEQNKKRFPEQSCAELLVSCPRSKHIFRCDQNGPPARRSEPDWQWEGAYLDRYVTDEQRSRRPIFIATLWAAASWLFF